MITKATFLKPFGGHGNSYSSFTVVDVWLDDLIDALNAIDPEMIVGSGEIEEHCIRFEVCKTQPGLIHDITAKLHCKGFADTGAWYGPGYFEASYDGAETDEFTAVWESGCPDHRADEDVWDAFVIVTDPDTGVIFSTGDGAVSAEDLAYWQDLVRKH